MTSINSKIVRKVVKRMGDKLTGDWVLIGGSLLSYLGVQTRVTEDIDVAKIADEGNDQLIEMFSVAEELKLPVETINQAAAYFLKRIPNWKRMLVPLFEGKKATIYRPNATLFLLLKIQRCNETDYLDCIEFLKFSKGNAEKINLKLVNGSLDKLRAAADCSAQKKKRLFLLREQLND